MAASLSCGCALDKTSINVNTPTTLCIHAHVAPGTPPPTLGGGGDTAAPDLPPNCPPTIPPSACRSPHTLTTQHSTHTHSQHTQDSQNTQTRLKKVWQSFVSKLHQVSERGGKNTQQCRQTLSQGVIGLGLRVINSWICSEIV